MPSFQEQISKALRQIPSRSDVNLYLQNLGKLLPLSRFGAPSEKDLLAFAQRFPELLRTPVTGPGVLKSVQPGREIIPYVQRALAEIPRKDRRIVSRMIRDIARKGTAGAVTPKATSALASFRAALARVAPAAGGAGEVGGWTAAQVTGGGAGFGIPTPPARPALPGPAVQAAKGMSKWLKYGGPAVAAATVGLEVADIIGTYRQAEEAARGAPLPSPADILKDTFRRQQQLDASLGALQANDPKTYDKMQYMLAGLPYPDLSNGEILFGGQTPNVPQDVNRLAMEALTS